VSRDLRKYARSTNVRLSIGALFLLFVVGLGLIYWIYGREAAVLGFFCLLAAMVPIGFILLFLAFTDWVVKRANRD
jgi:hypothetical protein